MPGSWECRVADRTRLAIAIPTYARAAMVAENLAAMAEEAQALGIEFYVSDDSGDDATQRAVADLSQTYGNLRYRRNDPALKHDRNLIETLCWPDADYVWLLGDALRVEPGMLARILDFLDRQDMVFVRAHAEDARMIPAATGEDALALTRELLWHQTLTGATIYSRSVCDWVRTHREDMTLKQNFPQVSVILGFLSAHDARVGWFGEPALRSLPKESYWMSRAITTFVDDWVALVLAFPEVIPPAARAQVIRSHSANTRLFGVGLLHRLRQSGELTWQDLRKPHFFDAMHLNRAAILAVMLMPAGISRLADRVAKRFGAGRS